jgi:hypothetical protein
MVVSWAQTFTRWAGFRTFLQQHPNRPYREFVIHLVGQAYATWWSLSNDPTSAMADYADPKLYQEGSEQARLKAIGSFEHILKLSPRTLRGDTLGKSFLRYASGRSP